jgi:hypothetical protein
MGTAGQRIAALEADVAAIRRHLAASEFVVQAIFDKGYRAGLAEVAEPPQPRSARHERHLRAVPGAGEGPR